MRTSWLICHSTGFFLSILPLRGDRDVFIVSAYIGPNKGTVQPKVDNLIVSQNFGTATVCAIDDRACAGW